MTPSLIEILADKTATPSESFNRILDALMQCPVKDRADEIVAATAHLVEAGDTEGLGTLARTLGRSAKDAANFIDMAALFWNNDGRAALVPLLESRLQDQAQIPLGEILLLREEVIKRPVEAFRTTILRHLLEILAAHKTHPQPDVRMRVLAMILADLGWWADAKEALEVVLMSNPLDRVSVETLLQANMALQDDSQIVMLIQYIKALQYKTRAKPPLRRQPTLLFVARSLNWRPAKLARALRSLGWRIEGLCINTYEEFEQYYDAVHRYRSDFEAAERVKEIDADITHFFTIITDYTTCALTLARGGSPVIADIYDMVNGMFNEADYDYNLRVERQAPLELYVMEHAHGLCMRNIEPQPLKRDHKLKIEGKVLFFPEYAWGDVECAPKYSDVDGVPHVIHAGWAPEWEIQAFCEAVRGLDVHVHFRPYYNPGWGEVFEEKYKFIFDEVEKNKNLHIEKPIFGRAFLKEVSKYDGQLAMDCITDVKYRSPAVPYYYSNKFSDCVDAGVLFIGDPGSFCVKLGRKYGISVGANRNDFEQNEFWLSLPERNRRADFKRARKEWVLDRQVERLDRFYRTFLP